jgi:hypothetical protein
MVAAAIHVVAHVAELAGVAECMMPLEHSPRRSQQSPRSVSSARPCRRVWLAIREAMQFPRRAFA